MDIPEIDVAELAACAPRAPRSSTSASPTSTTAAHVPGRHPRPPGRPCPSDVDEVPTDGTVYVICAKGGRSPKAVEFYRAQGIDAVNVAGGTMAWVDAGQPISTGMEP